MISALLFLLVQATTTTQASSRGWWCWSFTDKEDSALSQCVRTKARCDKAQADAVRQHWTVDMACRHQEKAAVYTYLDKLQNERYYNAFPYFKDCNKARSIAQKLRTEDFAEFSECYAAEKEP